MKIFLLEDDCSLNDSIKEILESEKFVVDSFDDGLKAYENISTYYGAACKFHHHKLVNL